MIEFVFFEEILNALLKDFLERERERDQHDQRSLDEPVLWE